MGLIHFTDYNPNFFSWNRTLNQTSIARLQTLDKSSALNREKKKEIGRSTDDGVVGYSRKKPDVSVSLSQLEHGSMDTYKALANKDVETLDLDDFGNASNDIVAYLTDQDDAFIGSKWYSNMRLEGFSINIGDPDSDVERSFDLVGEKDKILQGDNQYFIWGNTTVESGDLDSIDSVDIVISSPIAQENPDVTGEFMLQVLRVRANVVTKLSADDAEFTDTANLLTVADCQVDDIIKYAYSAKTQGSQTLMTLNDSDPAVISADSCSVYLYIPASGSPDVDDYVYRLQSVSIDVSFERLDLSEIGNNEVVERAIQTKTVSIGLNRFEISNAIEEVLRGEGADYGILDVEKFTATARVVVKIYSDNTKDTFKMGFKATGLSATELAHTMAVDEFTDVTNTIEGESLTITSVEANLDD